LGFGPAFHSDGKVVYQKPTRPVSAVLVSFFLFSVYVILNRADDSIFSLVGLGMSLGGWIVLVVAVVLAAFLFVPFVFTIDSERKIFHVHWLLFDLSIDLSTRSARVGVAGHFFKKKKKAAPMPPSSGASSPLQAEQSEKKRGARSLPQILLSHRALLTDLVQKLIRYLITLLRTFSIRELHLDGSSKDPVVDGICYGAIQGIRIKKVYLSVNFWGENRMVGTFSLRLYRLIVPTMVLLVQLPYVELYRLFKEMRKKDIPQVAEGAPTPS
jgi:hypothetical protein